jgi:hypothetical protein
MRKIFIIGCFILSAKTVMAQQNNNHPLPPVKIAGTSVILPQKNANQKPPVKVSDGVIKPTAGTNAFVPVKTTASNTSNKSKAVTVKAHAAASSRKP